MKITNLMYIRLLKGLTICKLAIQANVSKSAISRHEAFITHLQKRHVDKLSELLGVCPCDILGEREMANLSVREKLRRVRQRRGYTQKDRNIYFFLHRQVHLQNKSEL